MIRVACALAVLALVALVGMVFRTSGGTATLYAFIGIPALAAAVIVYLAEEGVRVRHLLVRWLGGATPLLLVFLLAGDGRADEAVDGAAAWDRLCVRCHGAGAQGDTPAGRALKVPPLSRTSLTLEVLERAVREGPKHASVSGQTTDEALRAILAHLIEPED